MQERSNIAIPIAGPEIKSSIASALIGCCFKEKSKKVESRKCYETAAAIQKRIYVGSRGLLISIGRVLATGTLHGFAEEEERTERGALKWWTTTTTTEQERRTQYNPWPKEERK